MEQTQNWKGLPYYPISQFYLDRFGEKVRKISVSVAATCPNREGLRGMQTCNFCDVHGSAAYPEKSHKPLDEQIRETRELMRRQYKAEKFLVYFQAYTNTFAKTAVLREQFEIAFSFSDVVGAVVGTRPDCISDAVLELWREYAAQKFISVELGVQTFNEDQLIWMRRGHTAKRSIETIERIKKECDLDLGIHLMFGLPGETDEEIVATAQLCNRLPIDNVKLHNLHVLQNTPLEEEFRAGKFTPLDRELYFERCTLFLQHLSPRIAVHRLAALSSRPKELVAPPWTALKMKTYQEHVEYMKKAGVYQGQYWGREDGAHA